MLLNWLSYDKDITVGILNELYEDKISKLSVGDKFSYKAIDGKLTYEVAWFVKIGKFEQIFGIDLRKDVDKVRVRCKDGIERYVNKDLYKVM